MKAFASRKFLLALAAAALFISNDMFGMGLADATLFNVVYVVGGYIGVEGLADIIERFKK